MRVLITGACGFVGSTIARELTRSGVADSVLGLDNLSRPGSERNRTLLQRDGIPIVIGDVRCASDLEHLPPVDWLIDASANASVLAGIDGATSSRQLVEHNLGGTLNLLEYCKRHGAGFVLLSTSRVYSIAPLAGLRLEAVDDAFRPRSDAPLPAGVTAAGINEAFPTTPPVSLYGSTKIASEVLALEYGETFGFPVWINRCGVMAGAGQFGHAAQGIIAYWVHSARERAPLKYIGFGGDGFQVRDALHPADLVPLLEKQFIETGATTKPRIANLAGGVSNAFSLRQLTRWCEARFGPLRVDAVKEQRPFDIGWMVLDSNLAGAAWGWRPQTGLQSILEQVADFAEHNPGWLDLSRGR